VFRQLIDNQHLWRDYVFGKQTLKQLSEQYSLSERTVRRKLNTIRPPRIISSSKSVVVLMDTTYWGRNFGVVVFKDAYTKRILWRKFVRHETLADYLAGVQWLEKHQFKIHAIVCDGLRGMFSMLEKYPVQMCQVHQIRIVRRYLTDEPILPASIELKALVDRMTQMDKQSFVAAFEQLSVKWNNFLREKQKDTASGKNRYMHRRVRSAYLSVNRNMPYLWTFQDYPNANIPNTNNGLEGFFTDLKTKLRNHNGLSKEHRKQFIDEYFKATFG
jgi:hypothetical protein